jgi:hypothetical protein
MPRKGQSEEKIAFRLTPSGERQEGCRRPVGNGVRAADILCVEEALSSGSERV